MENRSAAPRPLEMPRYVSHKQVWALKIEKVVLDMDIAQVTGRSSDGTATIVPVDKRYPPFVVNAEYVRKHNPHNGGYFVVYRDGYESFSPAEPFEEGYTLFVEDDDETPIDPPGGIKTPVTEEGPMALAEQSEATGADQVPQTPVETGRYEVGVDMGSETSVPEKAPLAPAEQSEATGVGGNAQPPKASDGPAVTE